MAALAMKIWRKSILFKLGRYYKMRIKQNIFGMLNAGTQPTAVGQLKASGAGLTGGF